MYNPRWPHTLSAYSEILDKNGIPETDEDGNAKTEIVMIEMVIYDSVGNPRFNVDRSFVTEFVTELPWGYRTATGGIRDSGDMFAADFKISCPMFLTHLEEGQLLKLTDYTHTFEGIVKKLTTYNWGTNIWLDKPGNHGGIAEQ